MRFSLVIWFSLYCLSAFTSPQTIEEKLEKSLNNKEEKSSRLDDTNRKVAALRSQLNSCFKRLETLSKSEASTEAYRQLLLEVNEIRTQIGECEEIWRGYATQYARDDEEGYGFWDLEETTLASLVMEYGSNDYLYIVPPEMASFKINLHSTLPIPRESWTELLDIILQHNGVGVKQLNPFAKQLYILKQDLVSVNAIVSTEKDLAALSNYDRVFYILSLPMERTRSVFQFFERFCDPKQTFIYQVGGKLAIISSKSEVEKLLSLYRTVWQDESGKITRVVSVNKMPVKEMEKIINTFFSEAQEKAKMPLGRVDQESFTVFALAQSNSLVLIGQLETVDRAEKIIRETESQIQESGETKVFLYNCRHTDPTDLADLLEKVYNSLLLGLDDEEDGGHDERKVSNRSSFMGFDDDHEHFIPDPKTGTLLMIIRKELHGKIKDLLKKLDIPKKMVQIEVLLFEKKLKSQTNYGLNLLKLGSNTGMKYNGLFAPSGKGVLEFMFGRGSKGSPPFDLAFSFLMTQEDVQLNTAPSVVTVNQVPATISIEEEISINTGAATNEDGKKIGGDSFTRNKYGIKLIFTPTIHMPDADESGSGFITLQTDITFDSTKPSEDNRPQVEMRHIENEVRVRDGETVIIGGLRRKSVRNEGERVPFLGDIPGIGKLFGSTKLVDDNSEMFFFITPKIITEEDDHFVRLRTEELKKRPGDTPEFLERMIQAHEREKKKIFERSLQMIFDADK